MGPGSAKHRFALHRVRDTSEPVARSPDERSDIREIYRLGEKVPDIAIAHPGYDDVNQPLSLSSLKICEPSLPDSRPVFE